jgi:ElaB/YqjD/DUF883 family membrane-anchored ribosome-binding protein
MSDKNGGQEAKPSIDELRADIQQTRSELGETVQALAAKADVKARAKDQVELTKQKVKAQAAEATEKVRGAAVAAGDKVRAAATQAKDSATDKVSALQSNDEARDPNSPEVAYATQEPVRSGPVPLSLVFAGVLALVGVILIVRGRRR